MGGLLSGSNPSFPNGLGTLAAYAGLTRWRYVRPRFLQSLSNLSLTPDQVTDGVQKRGSVVGSLNRNYRGHGDENLNCILIGSWAKGTQVRPPRDVDLLYELPSEVFWRFEKREGNKQSQLLQEVKEALQKTFPSTDNSPRNLFSIGAEKNKSW